MAVASVAPALNELDVMLQDLSQGHYANSNLTNSNNDYSVYSDFGSFTKVPTRPPPPKSSAHHLSLIHI